MAKLKLSNGTILTELTKIRDYLSLIKVELSHWPIDKTESAVSLLKKHTLTDQEKETLLKELDARFLEQQKKYGYQARDLVVLQSQTPNLDEMLKIFDKCHTHSDDEVRYIVDGSGIFGFCMPSMEQVLLTVETEDYIRVPAETEHWFILDNHRKIKAVRYFTGKEGWVANYTGTLVHAQP